MEKLREWLPRLNNINIKDLALGLTGLSLTACAQAEAHSQQIALATENINPPPTNTLVLTSTPTETLTPVPTWTETPSPTYTKTPTLTSTETPTPNPAIDVAKNLGYENCSDCKLTKDEGVDHYSLLRNDKDGVLGYWDVNNQKWVSTKGWKEIINETYKEKWEDFFMTTVSTVGPVKIPRIITDGEILTERYPITTKEGELLSTASVSVRGFYVDKTGKLQSVIFPQIVTLPNGKDFVIRGQDYIENMGLNDAKVADYIKSKPQVFNGGLRGKETDPVLLQDVSAYIKFLISRYGISGVSEVYRNYLELIDKYNKSWNNELQDFYNDGTPVGGIIFPANVAMGADVVDLPGE